MSKAKIIIIFLGIVLASGTAFAFVRENSQDTNSQTTNNKTATHSKPEPTEKSTFDTQKHSTTDPKSIWVIVNKQRQLTPKSYVPTDLRFPNVSQRVPGNESMKLRDEAATAVEKMFADAKKDGLNLEVSSGYRSYSFQVSLYGGYVQTQGQAEADTQSARPGYSEHQTGLALDIQPADGRCHLEECFQDTAEGKWVKEHAYKYGFIMRYTPTKQTVTGYTYEPWHFRYVGVDLATEMHTTNIETLEEFFKTGSAPDYQ